MTPDQFAAVQRLMRVKAGEDAVDVYGYRERPDYWKHALSWEDEARARADGKRLADRSILADLILSRVPTEERPVAMAELVDLAEAWIIVDDNIIKTRVRRPGSYAMFVAVEGRLDRSWEGVEHKAYATEAAARLALHWQLWDSLSEFAAGKDVTTC
jgi:hypothetical protein